MFHQPPCLLPCAGLAARSENQPAQKHGKDRGTSGPSTHRIGLFHRCSAPGWCAFDTFAGGDIGHRSAFLLDHPLESLSEQRCKPLRLHCQKHPLRCAKRGDHKASIQLDEGENNHRTRHDQREPRIGQPKGRIPAAPQTSPKRCSTQRQSHTARQKCRLTHTGIPGEQKRTILHHPKFHQRGMLPLCPYFRSHKNPHPLWPPRYPFISPFAHPGEQSSLPLRLHSGLLPLQKRRWPKIRSQE